MKNKPSAVALPQSKRIKKDKKPLNERKPISAYILYSSVVRHELKLKHPNETHSELMKIAG